MTEPCCEIGTTYGSPRFPRSARIRSSTPEKKGGPLLHGEQWIPFDTAIARLLDVLLDRRSSVKRNGTSDISRPDSQNASTSGSFDRKTAKVARIRHITAKAIVALYVLSAELLLIDAANSFRLLSNCFEQSYWNTLTLNVVSTVIFIFSRYYLPHCGCGRSTSKP